MKKLEESLEKELINERKKFWSIPFLYLKEILKFVLHFCRPTLYVGILRLHTPGSISVVNSVKEWMFFERFAVYLHLPLLDYHSDCANLKKLLQLILPDWSMYNDKFMFRLCTETSSYFIYVVPNSYFVYVQ